MINDDNNNRYKLIHNVYRIIKKQLPSRRCIMSSFVRILFKFYILSYLIWWKNWGMFIWTSV